MLVQKNNEKKVPSNTQEGQVYLRFMEMKEYSVSEGLFPINSKRFNQLFETLGD